MQKAVNEKCRKLTKRVAFYTVDCRSSCGEIFVDLQDYKYAKVTNLLSLFYSFHWHTLCFNTLMHFFFLYLSQKKLDETVECELTYPSFEVQMILLRTYSCIGSKVMKKLTLWTDFPFQEAVSVPWKLIPRRTAKLYFAMRGFGLLRNS